MHGSKPGGLLLSLGAIALFAMGLLVGRWTMSAGDARHGSPALPVYEAPAAAAAIEAPDKTKFLALLTACRALIITRADYSRRITDAPLARWKAAVEASMADTAPFVDGMDDPLYVDLELPDQRLHRCVVSLDKSNPRWGLGLTGEPFVPNESLLDLLREAAAGLEQRRRTAHGIVTDAAELRALSADCRRIDARALPTSVLLGELERFSAVEDLTVGAGELTDPDLAEIARLPGLRRLVVCAGVLSGEGFTAFATGALREVAFEGCRGLTSDGLRALASVPGIVALRFDESLPDLAGLLADARSFARLTELTVRDARLSDDDLRPLLLTKLRKLTLVDTGVTGAGLTQLAALPSLRELGLRGTQIDAGTLGALRRRLPNCEIDYRPPSQTPPRSLWPGR